MNIDKGIICFTFDDRNFEGWLNAIPLFKRYNAHGSFFISGDIDNEALTAARTLHDAGHTVGLHTKNHVDAPEYFEKHGAEKYFKDEIQSQKEALEKNGVTVTSFAYPNNRRTDETDMFLSQFFKRFRAGNKNSDEKYIRLNQIAEKRIMHGYGIGEYYNTVEDELLDKIRFAAKENVCITFFSHNICENAKSIHMPLQLLEKCLELAEKECVKILGFDDLP